MDLKYLNVRSEDGIAWVQFNRPEKLNALNPEVLRDLDTVVARCEQDDDIRVVVLTGNEKAFVAGSDIGHMAKGDIKSAYGLTDLTMRAQERLADLPKPTIAAISGYALGGGCEIALCCDFRIAADNAVLGLPEITLGIIPGGGGTQRLPRLVNLAVAARMILLGESINSEEAHRSGLVDKVVPLDCLEEEVKELASKLIERPFLALRAAKTAMRKGMSTSLKEGLQIEQDLFCMLFGTADQKEGMAAFLEKRKPVFKGK
ncbi:MAG: enoyl-CoA hydratase/isomerase family protein [Deltaproteobacteria bacterium]|nr:enoyl-CoA hydratase/isomerase family protein [Deltaproteobacteria bacterium]MBW1909712.1 enoyl-CoA hydratase/isomerase family protein [Deltaproteobacteria bacterium]